jgi:hypothetical protein
MLTLKCGRVPRTELAIAQAVDGTHVGFEDDFGTPAPVQAEEYFLGGHAKKCNFALRAALPLVS